MTDISLKSIFAQHSEHLSTKLTELTLPKDADKVQKVVVDLFDELFESDNAFRQSLTEAEDYILQSTILLLQAQYRITTEIAKSLSDARPSQERGRTPATSEKSSSPYYAIAGTGVGALAGGLLGTWGAIAGAIAGTAIVIYCASKPQAVHASKDQSQAHMFAHMDTGVFVSIVGQICECIDGVINTYRVQVKRIKNIYEQREKPSLLDECSALLSQVANVHKAVETNKADTPAKVVSATEMLVESLENYGLTIKDGKVVNE